MKRVGKQKKTWLLVYTLSHRGELSQQRKIYRNGGTRIAKSAKIHKAVKAKHFKSQVIFNQ